MTTTPDYLNQDKPAPAGKEPVLEELEHGLAALHVLWRETEMIDLLDELVAEVARLGGDPGTQSRFVALADESPSYRARTMIAAVRGSEQRLRAETHRRALVWLYAKVGEIPDEIMTELVRLLLVRLLLAEGPEE